MCEPCRVRTEPVFADFFLLLRAPAASLPKPRDLASSGTPAGGGTIPPAVELLERSDNGLPNLPCLVVDNAALARRHLLFALERQLRLADRRAAARATASTSWSGLNGLGT